MLGEWKWVLQLATDRYSDTFRAENGELTVREDAERFDSEAQAAAAVPAAEAGKWRPAFELF